MIRVVILIVLDCLAILVTLLSNLPIIYPYGSTGDPFLEHQVDPDSTDIAFLLSILALILDFGTLYLTITICNKKVSRLMLIIPISLLIWCGYRLAYVVNAYSRIEFHR